MALALNDVMEKKSSLDFKNQAFINGNYINSVTGNEKKYFRAWLARNFKHG